MTSYVMRVLSSGASTVGLGPIVFEEPHYVESYDVDARGGLGEVGFTDDVALALRFDSAATLMMAWRTQSTVMPLRPDGKPNRPLTALTILTEKAP